MKAAFFSTDSFCWIAFFASISVYASASTLERRESRCIKMGIRSKTSSV
jgi:hypothetical protein